MFVVLVVKATAIVDVRLSVLKFIEALWIVENDTSRIRAVQLLVGVEEGQRGPGDEAGSNWPEVSVTAKLVQEIPLSVQRTMHRFALVAIERDAKWRMRDTLPGATNSGASLKNPRERERQLVRLKVN